MTRHDGSPRGDLTTGDVVWISLDPVKGREQSGHRPAVVVAGTDYLDAVTTLVMVIPVTERHRGWPNHVKLEGTTGLPMESWAMTEQLRTVSRDRITGVVGRIDADCLRDIRMYLRDFLEV